MKIPLWRRNDELEENAHFLRYRRRSRPAAKPRCRRDRIRQPGSRACAQPAGFGSRRAGDRGATPRRTVVGAGAGGGPRRPLRGRRGARGRRHHDARPGPGSARGVRGRRGSSPAAREDAPLRARVQRALPRNRAPGRRGCRDDRSEVPRAPGAQRVPGGTGRAGARRGASGRERQRVGRCARLCRGDRLRPCGRVRDDVPRGDGDRPVRRANRVVRRRDRADPGRFRDSHGRGVRAGDRLLRVHARAEADRGPDVSRRDEVHAVLDQRHRGVRRLYPGPEGRDAGGSRGDGAHPGRYPVRQLRARVDRREPGRGPPAPGVAQGRGRASDRAGRRQAARHDAVDGGGESGSGFGARGSGIEWRYRAPSPQTRAPQGMIARTLFDKVWDAHVVHQFPEGPALLYVDLHLVHEVTSPQAFDGLRQAGRRVRRPALTVATVDHNVPTGDRAAPIADPIAARQLEALAANARDFGLELFDLRSPQQGIVHVIGPELGLTQPGMVIVCGDSHTATHGAFGALALGIGTSEVEHVLATQCLVWSKPGTMEALVTGTLAPGVTAKDLILALIGRIGTAGATGHVIEYTGEAIRALSMEQRMTVCNMSIEAGARAGMIAPDETTVAYLAGRPRAPSGAAWDRAVGKWRELHTDPGATYDKHLELDASEVAPQVTWGTSPGMVTSVTGRVPSPADFTTDGEQRAVTRALEYMGLVPGTPLEGLPIDRVFLGSCTNARIEDLRAAARTIRGRHVATGVRAMVVPGSQQVKAQAEREGLDRVFSEAGFEWRNAGCSMCLGMNPDVLQSGERCASTSNRNFEGRQGRGGRTHLMSPPMAAAAAVAGHIVDVRRWGAGGAAP